MYARFFMLTFTLFVILAGNSQAFDFQNQFYGVKSSAMGHTYTGMDNNVEVVWLNPAFMSSFSSKGIIETGAHARRETGVFNYREPSLYQASTDNPVNISPYLYAVYKINERFALGLAFNNAFSEQIRWQEENWAGRFILREYFVNSQLIQPALSVKIIDGLHLGVGVFYVSANAGLQRSLPLRDANREANMRINGRAAAVGFNAGLAYSFSENVNVSLNYKSALSFTFEDNRPEITAPNSLMNFFPQPNKAEFTADMPAMLDLSGGIKINERLTAAWSTVFMIFDNSSTPRVDFQHQTDHLQNFSISRYRKNNLVAGIGASYKTSNYLILRGGSYYETRSADENFFAPVSAGLDRIAISAGASFLPVSGLYLDVSLVYIAGLTSDALYLPANFGGTYRSSVFVPGFSVGYGF